MPAPQPLVYIGTDTQHPAAKGIYLARFDQAAGRLSSPVLAAPGIRASYLALNQLSARRVMYACDEGNEQTSAIVTYLVDPATGALRELGRVSSGGAGPCFISVDASGHSAFVANYSGGTVASYLVQPDGTLKGPVDRVDMRSGPVFAHHGPNKERQDASHPHSAMLSPSNRFLLVDDLGTDSIATFPVDPLTARLGPPHVLTSRTPGAGPRHLAFHPNGRWVYGIDELTSRINQYLWNSTHGSAGMSAQGLLTDASHSVDTLDPAFHGKNTAAEVLVAPSGYFLYASNRGEDSLVVFAIDQVTGALKLSQRIACGGRGPRHFTLSPTGDYLLCGNQLSASVTVFTRNPGNGKLTGPTQSLPLEAPMFTLFA